VSQSPSITTSSPSSSPNSDNSPSASNNQTASGNKEKKNSSSTPIIAGVLGSVGGAFCVAGFFVVLKWKKQRRRDPQEENGEVVELHAAVVSSSSPSLSNSSTIAKFGEIEKGWRIKYEDVTLKEELGRGAFGVVHKGEWRNTDCVIKLLNENLYNNSNESINAFLREAHNVKNMRNHTNVCSIFGICTNPVAIVMEYVPGGSLLNCIANKKIAMTPSRIVKFARDIASGMSHLHAENIIHLDLACRNLLVTFTLDDCIIKITDFGLSRIIDSDTYTASMEAKFPIRWSAPEVLSLRMISRACDVWSFGITLWEMIERQIPYEGIPTLEVVKYVQNGNRLPRPTKVPIPDSLWELMLSCWNEVPAERPTFSEICTKLKSIEEEAALLDKNFVLDKELAKSDNNSGEIIGATSTTYVNLLSRGNDSGGSQHTYGNVAAVSVESTQKNSN